MKNAVFASFEILNILAKVVILLALLLMPLPHAFAFQSDEVIGSCTSSTSDHHGLATAHMHGLIGVISEFSDDTHSQNANSDTLEYAAYDQDSCGSNICEALFHVNLQETPVGEVAQNHEPHYFEFVPRGGWITPHRPPII